MSCADLPWAATVHNAVEPARFPPAPRTDGPVLWLARMSPDKGPDIAIQAKEMLRTRERVARDIARETGQPLAKVSADMDRDYWMNAEEAIEYGIVSRVVKGHQELV